MVDGQSRARPISAAEIIRTILLLFPLLGTPTLHGYAAFSGTCSTRKHSAQ